MPSAVCTVSFSLRRRSRCRRVRAQKIGRGVCREPLPYGTGHENLKRREKYDLYDVLVYVGELATEVKEHEYERTAPALIVLNAYPTGFRWVLTDVPLRLITL